MKKRKIDWFLVVFGLILAAYVIYSVMPSGNVFLSGKDAGITRACLNNVLIVGVQLNLNDSSWTEREWNSFLLELESAGKKLENDAVGYSAVLDVDTAYMTHTLSDITVSDGDARSNDHVDMWERFCKEQGVKDLKELEEFHNAQYNGKYDEICYVFSMNKYGRSFARSSTKPLTVMNDEFACVFNTENNVGVLAHEVLHLFGAKDFYYTEEIMMLTDDYLGESIMKSGSAESPVDALTAYVIGWTDELGEREKEFLKKTQKFSLEDFKEMSLNAEFEKAIKDRQQKVNPDASKKPAELIFFAD